MAVFNNVSLADSNISIGPTSGYIYSLSSSTNSLIVKTFPAGTLVATVPTDQVVGNSVLSLQYDGMYFYSLHKLGVNSDLGIVINKWLLESNLLVKQTGIGSIIQLVNTGGQVYDSSAFCIQRFITSTAATISAGTSSFIISDGSYISIGDTIYLGPSSAAGNTIQARTVSNVVGSTVYLNSPVTVQFNSGDAVTYVKNTWIFNNENNGSTNKGSLIQVNSHNGLVQSVYSSCEWQGVSAANCVNGNIGFIKGTQFLQYKPFGINAGYQSSAILSNIQVDNNTVITVADFWTDNSNIYKLQTMQHQYDVVNYMFNDVISLYNNYNVDTEQLAAKVFSATATRSNSVLFSTLATETLLFSIRDQFNIPVFGRSMSVAENDPSGYISAGGSFVTNTQGQGASVYNTGSSPAFGSPVVSITDISSRLQFGIILSQVPSAGGENFVSQSTNPSTVKQLVQQTISGYIPLIQATAFEDQVPIEQRQINYQMPLQQYLTSGIVPISQVPLPIDSSVVVQYAATSGVIDISQYNFLIQAIPLPYTKKVQPNVTILVRIVGFGGTALNLSTLVFKINGVDVTSQLTITAFSGGLQLVYVPSDNFLYSSTVVISISIQDTNNPVRTISTTYPFYIIDDYIDPVITELYPPDKSINNLTNTDIYCIVTDNQTGVDLNSIEFYIEGIKVSPTLTILDNHTVKVNYQTIEDYPYNSSLNVSILVSDLEGNKILESWEFQTQPSPGVLFIEERPGACEYLVPVDSSICLEAFGLNEGINLESAEYTVQDKPVTYVIKPKVYRSE
jgi:hypothetical protein